MASCNATCERLAAEAAEDLEAEHAAIAAYLPIFFGAIALISFGAVTCLVCINT